LTRDLVAAIVLPSVAMMIPELLLLDVGGPGHRWNGIGERPSRANQSRARCGR